MGMINMALRDSATVPTPDVGRLIMFADTATGRPRAKSSAGVIYDFIGNTGTRGSVWTASSSVPTASALAGDMHFKTDNGAVYQSAGGTNWVYVGSIMGLQGPQPPLGATVQEVGSSNSAGSSNTASKSDHVHGHGTQAGGSLHAVATGSANGFMSSTDKTKLDTYGALASTITDVGATSAVGTAAALARADHVHAHGNQAGDALHTAATTSANGFMSAADKTKLDTYPLVTIDPQAIKTTATALSVANTQVYIEGLVIPAGALNVGSILRVAALCTVAAGTTTAAVLTVRFHFGTTGTTADAVIATTAMPTGSASGSAGSAEVVSTAVARAVSASGVFVAATRATASGTAAMGTAGNGATVTTSSTVNNTVAGILGVSFSCNVANIWTVQSAWAEVLNQ